ncbi:TPA: hypothetical protein ACTALY_003433 [Salmonella enterica subsp. enterica serovar Muenchen]|nr:hypothetical protein [Salmonella enterica subsp. enterica serovar Muenchen]HED0221194.1 hypothetical protein [Salmonella enterica subsp. enterica serovar Muenchen]
MLKNEGWKGYLLTSAKWTQLMRESFGVRKSFIFMNEVDVKASFNSNSRLIRDWIYGAAVILKRQNRYLKNIIFQSEQNVRIGAILFLSLSGAAVILKRQNRYLKNIIFQSEQNVRIGAILFLSLSGAGVRAWTRIKILMIGVELNRPLDLASVC